MDEQMAQRQKTERGQAGKNAGESWHRDICRGIVMAYFLVMTLIFPFYAPGGYLRIGEVKFVFFRNMSLVTLAAAAAVLLLAALLRRDRTWIIRLCAGMSVTDWFAYGYLTAVMLSYLCSPYRKEALWGAEGWYMGTVVQLLLAALYFLFSRYFHCDVRWIAVWLAAASGVSALGICDRYSVPLIEMEGRTAAFISTLGNINWFCGYWSVAAAVGIALYWCGKSAWVRVLSAVCSVIAMLAGVTQGSESAYPVFLALLFLLFGLSLGRIGRMCRLLELGMLFGASCLLGRVMMALPGLRYNYVSAGGGPSGVTAVLLEGRAAWFILAASGLACVLLRAAQRKGCLCGERMTARCDRHGGLTALILVGVFCIAAVTVLSVSGAFRGGGMSAQEAEKDGIFAEDWGNGRGAAWNAGIDAYGSMDVLHKAVGIGPDCFAEYVYDVPQMADRLAEQFVNQRLTNAHNERLTLLVNLGAFGWFCYTGLFLTAFVRFLRRAKRQPFLYVCAAGIASYWVHNTVSFQQVLSVPFAFMLLGIGERICREPGEEDCMDRAARRREEDGQPVQRAWQTAHRAAEYLSAVLAAVMCLVLAFYVRDGYHQIGSAKFAAYRAVMIPGGALLLAAAAACLILRAKERRQPRFSVTDCCVSAYLVFVLLSVAAGGFYGDALWGFDGWNMGLMAQISFVLLYFMASRFGRYYRSILAVLCCAACVVYALGILNRLLFDPLGYYDGLTEEQMAQFLSTLGQNTWYASFLMVTLPVGMSVFLYADRKLWRVLGGIFMTVGFGTLVTQNSDSAYFGLAGVFVVFFVLSAGRRERLCRYMAALTLFFASGKIMYLLVRLRPNPALQPDFVTDLMWTSGVTWVLLVLCLAGTLLLYAMERGFLPCRYPEAFLRRLCRLVPVLSLIAAAVAAALIVLRTRGLLPEAVSDRLAAVSYFNWNDDWGNGRGRIWTFSAKTLAGLDLPHKLFGVGPDCFHSYVALHYGEEERLLWGQKKLPNAHNEWFTMLINAGLFGTAAYIGIFLASVRTALRRARKNVPAAGIAAACVSYMCYNFFCYQQVLCTPIIFLLMGIGAYIDREEASAASTATDSERKWAKMVDKIRPKV